MKTEGDAFFALPCTRSTEENELTVTKNEFDKKRKIQKGSSENSLQDTINFVCASNRIFEENKKTEKRCISSQKNCNFKNIIKLRFQNTKLMPFSDSSRHFQSFHMYFYCNQ